MTITLTIMLAALIAIPSIIAIAQAADGGSRIMAAIMLALIVIYVAGPKLPGGYVTEDIGKYIATAVGVWSIVCCVRIQHTVVSTLIVVGGVLTALLAWKVVVVA